ncbi:GGDEF domain-containing protein [Chromatiaceae bacterium AAb-1]|nr:GGDEF domain-containing protein [Chromatiaceae bacterium AAb-1]
MSAAYDYCTELKQIISQRALTPLFQPVLSLGTARLFGYEALIRGPSDSPLHSPVSLFKTAMACKMLEPLEMLCREISIRAFASAGVDGLLFLNVNPLLLLTADHPSGLTRRLLQDVALDPSRVVIEISEQYQVEDPSLLIKAVHHYRELGFSIAIDDLGSGFSGLKLWSEIKPDIVKIDRYFISEVHADPTKRAFVQNIVALAKATGATIVAEGIETQEELLLCQELGADYGQGYLLGRPSPQLRLPVYGQQSLKLLRHLVATPQESIASVLLDIPAIAATILAGEVIELFSRNPAWHSLPVIDGDRPAGIISRSALQEFFSHPYGRALYERKPIIQFVSRNPVIVDESCTFDQVSQLVVENEENTNSWFFIITRQGYYLGLGSVRTLLKKITERKLQHARYANPLTLLPGNVPIYQEIDSLLQQQQLFAVAYFDLNHFKPYNDIYGYSRGDLVLQLLADIINNTLSGQDCFIGHVGGDDFVVIFRNTRWQESCESIISQFDQRIVHYYDKKDIQAGGINALNRTGEAQFFPLLSLAIGVASPDPELCLSHHDVAALVTAAKHEAKKNPGSAVFVSRRRGPSDSRKSVLARPLAQGFPLE